MTKRSPDLLAKLLQSTTLVTFDQMQAALGDASRATTFRYLKQVPTLRSYNHNGRYYTNPDPTGFDRWGLASYGDVHFSRDGTLAATVKRLVRESTAGVDTKRTPGVAACARAGVVIGGGSPRRDTKGEDRLVLLFIFTPTRRLGKPSDKRVRHGLTHTRASEAADAVALDSDVIIDVLLVLLRHGGLPPAQVVRHLHGHSPPITLAQVTEVFARYALEELGKKGGATHS